MPTRAVVGVSAVALSRSAVSFFGITRGILGDVSVVMPDVDLACTTTAYATPGTKPAIVQPIGDGHVTEIGVPPPTGEAVKVYELKGPPSGGLIAESAAVVSLAGSAAFMTGALQKVQLFLSVRSPYPRC